jgi:hypothetical protein
VRSLLLLLILKHYPVIHWPISTLTQYTRVTTGNNLVPVIGNVPLAKLSMRSSKLEGPVQSTMLSLQIPRTTGCEGNVHYLWASCHCCITLTP